MPSRPAAMLSNFTMAVRGVSHPFFFSYGSAVSRCGAAFYVPNGGVRLYSRFSRAYRQVSVQMGAPASSR